jgi:hypothetical protein
VPAHLLVAITPHGFGHAMPTIGVIDALRDRRPDLRVTVMTTLSRAVIESRLSGPFALVPGADDGGMVMAGPLDVRIEESAAAYGRLHAAWDGLVAATASTLASVGPDFVLSNVSAVALAAARLAGIPAAALCSFHWGEVYGAYCGSRPEAPAILDRLRGAYAGAGAFLRVEPGTPMAGLDNVVDVGPVAALGRDRRAEVRAALGVPGEVRLVLADLGGIMPPSGLRLPRVDRVQWLVVDPGPTARHDVGAIAATGVSFLDAVASVDAVVTKLGYGTVVEAACNGARLLYVPRDTWPEEPGMVAWLVANACAAPIDRGAWQSGGFGEELETLLARPVPPPPRPIGAGRAAAWLDQRLP